MKITFITNNLSGGGAEKIVVLISKGLSAKGHDVTIINLNRANKSSQINVEDVSIISLTPKKYGFIPLLLGLSIECSKFVRRLKPDVLIGFANTAMVVASITGILTKTKSIIAERNDPYTDWSGNGINRKLQRFFLNRANGGVFQTQGAANFFSERIRNKSVVIPNPITIDIDKQIKDYSVRPHTIVSLGRLHNKQKRLDLTLLAYNEFHKKHPDYKLIIYGSGPSEDDLHQIVLDLDLQPYVIFKGISSDSISDMSKEGIFLMTSDYEGISNSLLEAMAIGMPVVSTDHSPGGARFLIEDHKNGLLVPIGNVSAISEALSEYADNRILAQHCGCNAKYVLSKFTPAKIIACWEQYILKFK